MKKKILPVLVALFLIILIGGIAVGSFLVEKYSYSKEKADLNEYFQVSGDRLAIILQDDILEEKAVLRDGICYFDLATVHQYFNEIFYVDKTENLLLYTTATEIIRSGLGETTYNGSAGIQDVGYMISFMEDDTVYIAADFVKQYTNFSYDI